MNLLLFLFALLKLISNFLYFNGASTKLVDGLVFACITGLCLTLVLLTNKQIKYTKLSLLLAALFITGFIVLPVSGISNNIVYYNYVFGDAVIIFYLIVILLFFANYKGAVSINSLRSFLLYLSIIDLLSWLINIYFLGIRTFPITPFAYILSFGFFSKIIWHRILSISLAILSIGINFLSTGKINSISYFILLLFILLIYMQARPKYELLLVFSILVVIVSQLNIPVIEKFESTRIYRLLRDIRFPEKYSLSITERVNEVSSVYKSMHTISPGTFFVGLGHGAVWDTKHYPGELRSLYRNLTKEGFIHNIHIGPILLIFRYGVFGILTFFYFIYLIGGAMIHIVKKSKYLTKGEDQQLNLILLFTTNVLVILLFRLLVMNTLIDPLFGFVLGLHIFIFNKIKLSSFSII